MGSVFLRVMATDSLYPPAPANVPPEITRLGSAYRLRVLAMIVGLFLFLLLYLFFIAVAVPRDGAWELQVVSVPATIGPKLRRLFKTEKKQRETPRTA